ncbi:MAG: nitroreductase family protein [Peptostreptococcaceae bacterium]|jgi:nitroreductase|nr:nitroreductase family protein [Peptostreptococcaceae bacterium]
MKLDFIYNRHSVRKFKDQEIPKEDIKEILKAATYAPSGKNIQNWHFVVIQSKEKINEIVKIIENKHDYLINNCDDEELNANFSKFLRYFTLFKNAPVLVMVFAGPYGASGLEVLQKANISDQEINSILNKAPGIQNIGAAVQNIQLAATAMGYGACWMTGPNFAAKEIEDYINIDKNDYTLACLVPIGVPQGDLKSPKRKPLNEVVTFID